MRNELSPELLQRAVAIADGRCRSDIEIMGIEVAGCPGRYSLTTLLGQPSRSLGGASPTLQESVAWLQARELLSLRVGKPGVIVELHLDRFAPTP